MDLEPDYSTERAKGIVFRRVNSLENAACGFSVALSAFSSSVPPNDVDIKFIDCTASRNGQAAYTFEGMHSPNVTG